MAAQFKRDERKIPARAHSVDGARDQFFSGAGFAQDQHRGIGRRNHFHLSHDPLHGRAGSDNLLEVVLGPRPLPRRYSPAGRAPAGPDESDPAKRREFQDGRGNQNRNPSPVLADQLLFKGRASPEPQTFFVGKFVESHVFRRREIGPAQPAGEQIFAAVSNEFEKSVVRLGNAVELSGNDARNGRFRAAAARACAAAPQLLVPLVTVAKVAHHPGKALQISILVFQGHGDDVGPESRSILPHVPAFIPDMAFR